MFGSSTCDYGSIQVFISGPARLFANSNKVLKFVNETSTMLAMFVQLIVKHLKLVVYSVSFMFWVPQWMEPIEAFRTCMPLMAPRIRGWLKSVMEPVISFSSSTCRVQVVLFTDCSLGSLVWTFNVGLRKYGLTVRDDSCRVLCSAVHLMSFDNSNYQRDTQVAQAGLDSGTVSWHA